jgi:cyclophilin family peptidyl-prolyl cis-trans isomerase
MREKPRLPDARRHRAVFLMLVWMAGLTSSPRLFAGTLAEFRTVFGTMEVELFDQDKPLTVRNFVRYVDSDRYKNGIIHRCPVVNTNTLLSDFVIQGGGSYVANHGAANWYLESIPRFDPIPNEFAVGRRFNNVYGTLAMAKQSGDTNSAKSEWFFNLKDNPELDAPDTNHLFVVFGRVRRGTNVLEMFKTFRLDTGTARSNVVVNWGIPPYQEVPMLAAVDPDLESNLISVDISLLTARVQVLTGGTPEISWTSVSDRVNVVEYATDLPPVWAPLVSTNGNGTLLRITDPNAPAPGRFYRVRVDY